MAGTYSRRWFELFLETRPYTHLEVEFIVRQLPVGPGGRVLDVCCGQGRIANPLAALGFEVLGVDVDAEALRIAAAAAPAGAQYRVVDMRDLTGLPGGFDAVLCWWQSFGFFDEATNRAVLRQMASKVRPGGRLLVDLYQACYWRAHQDERRLVRRGVPVLAKNAVVGDRLTCELRYEDGAVSDVFEWQLFDQEELTALATAHGLELLVACTDSDESRPVTRESASMQLVFQRVA